MHPVSSSRSIACIKLNARRILALSHRQFKNDRAVSEIKTIKNESTMLYNIMLMEMGCLLDFRE